MKKTSSKILSVLLVIVMTVSILPYGAINASAAGQVSSFTPRTTIPKSTDKYMVEINCSNNCARYACARISEILGVHIRDAYGIHCGKGYQADNCNAAPLTVFNTLKKYFPVGKTPKPGSVALTYSSSKATHIAIVESVDYANGTMCITEGNSYSNTSGSAVNGQYLLNGKDIVGKDTRTAGTKPGTWFCYRRVSFNKSTGAPASGFGSGTFQGYLYLVNDSANSTSAVINSACEWAVKIANDNTHGYNCRWLGKAHTSHASARTLTGPDYDCSSFVGSAYYYAGVSGVSSIPGTDNMKSVYLKAGFTWHSAAELGGQSNILKNLIKGDVILWQGHTELYIGDGKYAGANSDRDKKTGDSSGKEVYVKNAFECMTSSGKEKHILGVLRYEDASNVSYKYSVGYYKCTSNAGCNITASSQLKGLVPYNGIVHITEVDNKLGYCTFGDGVSGWVDLTKFTATTITALQSTSLKIDKSKVSLGESVKLTFATVGATYYSVYQNGVKVYSGAGSTYVPDITKAGTYSFYVIADNAAKEHGSQSNTVSCEVMSNKTVKFVDYNGEELSSQSVKYGASATAPSAPARKGYTFNGWDKSYGNVTTDITVTATYTKKTYTVNFYGKKTDENSEPELLATKKVAYGENATPPTNTGSYTGYTFKGWNSTAYKNVYTENNDSTINIFGIYEWSNYNLPIILSNVSASREREADGYNVSFKIQNYDAGTTKGRAIITLKTAEGKLISTTESASFKVLANGTKEFNEFVDCDKVATKVEVVIVNGISSGVPLSKNIKANVSTDAMWSDWQDTKPTGTGIQIEERTLYSSRSKITATNNKKTLDGYTYDGTYTTSVGNWSGWSDSSISAYSNESSKREVETKTVDVYSNVKYECYYHFYKSGGGSHTYCPTTHAGGVWHQILVKPGTMTWRKYSDCGGRNMYSGPACSSCGATLYWFRTSNPGTDDVVRNEKTGTKTQWRYRDTQFTYNFYKWSDFSAYSETAVSSSDTVDVQTKKQYRYFSTASTLEDKSGNSRTVSSSKYGKLADYAGKQLTLFIYKYDEVSDYTDEFVGQTTIASDGSYSFTFKLREEPSVKTGDYTIAIGIEGQTELKIIGVISAPKPVYTVRFYDGYGNIISTQNVTEGNNATVPATPEKTGYRFICWNNGTTNIKDSIDIYPVFEQEEYTVVYVDWLHQTVSTKKYKSGEVIIEPQVEDVYGYNFIGWDALQNGSVNATSDMVITALFEKKEYTVKFMGPDNITPVSNQVVKFGDSAYIPVYNGEETVYAFVNPEDYQNVESDAVIFPEYFFDETTPSPTANYETGEYNSNLSLELSCEDENAVIYYKINESEEEIEYTHPIIVDKTCSITVCAESLGKNNSEPVTYYYCINNASSPSKWMPYEQLPTEVKNNTSDYNLESDTGYRFKDIQKVSTVSEDSSLSKSGWTLSSTQTVYSSWQDDALTVDSSKINCKVETQNVADSTVTNYKYSHYKYKDASGKVCYAASSVSGYTCTLEEITLKTKLSVAGFLEDMTSYYNYNDQTWFNQTKVTGTKTQYRYSYSEKTYYKWTEWGVVSPADNETRETNTATVYRYSNKNYHIVELVYEETTEIKLCKEGSPIDLVGISDVYGYTLKGLYTDCELTALWNTSNPITKSMTFYVSYSPVIYEVVFCMQDGTELDTQSVAYLDSAVAPDTDSVPGFVFAGWDKDFSTITEDTVVVGKYIKESLYARVSLDHPNLMMYSGNYAVLKATISPSNLSNEKIIWASTDPNIAIVDDNGMVNAVSSGTATIIATVVSTNETAFCDVTVSEDASTSILLNNNAEVKFDSERNLRLSPSDINTVYELKTQFENEELTFCDSEGNVILDDGIVTTQSTISLLYNGKTSDKVNIVCVGDFNCDGKVNNKDIYMLNQYVVELRTATYYQMLAIDVNGDGNVNNRDCAMLARYLVGKQAL